MLTSRLLGAVGIVAVVGRVLAAQTPANPAIEVASIKANTSGDPRIVLQVQAGGRLVGTNVPLRALVTFAYQLPPGSQIVGGPPWVNSDRFDIVAKGPGDFSTVERPDQGPVPQALMLRALLADRFKLTVHNESREQSVYALVTARSDKTLGSGIRPNADCAAVFTAPPSGSPPPSLGSDQRPPCGAARVAPGNLSANGMTFVQLAAMLSNFVQRTVLNRTGITGFFDIDLNWTPDQMPRGDPPPGAPPLPPIDPNGPSIFTAIQEQLGLKLESTTGPVDVLVIDHAERPTEN